MADQDAKLLDLDEIWYSEVCGSLITNPSAQFRNSKWRIQYGGKKIQKAARFRKKSVLGFFFKIPDSKYELKSEIKNKIKKN